MGVFFQFRVVFRRWRVSYLGGALWEWSWTVVGGITTDPLGWWMTHRLMECVRATGTTYQHRYSQADWSRFGSLYHRSIGAGTSCVIVKSICERCWCPTRQIEALLLGKIFISVTSCFPLLSPWANYVWLSDGIQLIGCWTMVHCHLTTWCIITENCRCIPWS